MKRLLPLPLLCLLPAVSIFAASRAIPFATPFATPFPTPDYVSPYAFQFREPAKDRMRGWDRSPWNDPAKWGTLPRASWYDREAYRLRSFENLAYGVQPVHFPAPPKYRAMSPALKRERVLTEAARHIGAHYEHHHLPNFNPYREHPDWPWIKVASGLRTNGQDCSNFVAWCYNYALGIKLSGAVGEAARQTDVPGPGGGDVHIRSWEKTDGTAYVDFVKQLRAGDVIYIRGNNGRITHSVLWVGTLATDSNGKDKYFVIDSTGPEHVDSNGATIPDGVHLRPFRKNSWYFRSAAIVHRIVEDNE